MKTKERQLSDLLLNGNGQLTPGGEIYTLKKIIKAILNRNGDDSVYFDSEELDDMDTRFELLFSPSAVGEWEVVLEPKP